MPMIIDPARLLPFGPGGWRLPDCGGPPGDDSWRPTRSSLVLCQDGTPLAPAHQTHAALREGKRGFSHWAGMLLFSPGDGSSPLDNGRTYSLRHADAVPAAADPEEQAVRRLEAAARDGRELDGMALARLLSSGSAERRAAVCIRLADACFDADRGGDGLRLEWRAWRLGRRRPDAWIAVLDWLRGQGRGEDVEMMLRTAAQAAAEQGDAAWAVDIALRFEAHVYERYVQTRRMPFQDDSMAPALARALSSWACPPAGARRDGRLRVGYVAAAESEADYSALPEIAAELVLAHDAERVEALFLSLRDRDRCLAVNPFLPPICAALEQAGCPPLFLEGDAVTAADRARQLADRIAALDLDVLVFLGQGGLDFVLAALRPARRMVSLGLGDVNLYTSRVLDLTAHFSLKPAMDGLSPSVVVPCFMPQARFARPEAPAPRAELGLPDDAPVLMLSARPVKYREAELWAELSAVLAARPLLWLAAIGLTDELFARLRADHALPDAVAARVRPLGWRNDHQRVLAAGTFYLDTFPNGGGYAVFEAINLGLPAVAVEDDYLEPFDERSWAPAAELLDGIGVPRARLLDTLCRLCDDDAARTRLLEAGRRALARLADARLTAGALEQAFRAMF